MVGSVDAGLCSQLHLQYGFFLVLYPFLSWKVNSLTGKVLKSGKQECFQVFPFEKLKQKQQVFKEEKKKKEMVEHLASHPFLNSI